MWFSGCEDACKGAMTRWERHERMNVSGEEVTVATRMEIVAIRVSMIGVDSEQRGKGTMGV
jgi:hypothetical protein